MKQLEITIPLKLFVDSHLGYNVDTKERFWNCRPIDPTLAQIIQHLIAKEEQICHIQFADEMSPHLSNPLLWDIGAWRRECDKWVREKIASDKRRVERFIFEANAKLIAKAFSKFSGIPLEAAQVTAYKLLLKNNLAAIKVFGVDKLITKESEL